MLIKWITCQVKDSNKSAFTYAQEQWKGLSQLGGFRGQFGGWNLKDPFEAGILSYWDSAESYRAFMHHEHDAMYLQTNQRDTYKNITISIFEDCSTIHPVIGRNTLQQAHILRIAECEVKPTHQVSFEQAQHEIWNQGMAQSMGMLGGMFCHQTKQSEQYVVASLWASQEDHQHYVDHTLSALMEQTNASQTVHRIKGSLIELDAHWTINRNR